MFCDVLPHFTIYNRNLASSLREIHKNYISNNRSQCSVLQVPHPGGEEEEEQCVPRHYHQPGRSLHL